MKKIFTKTLEIIKLIFDAIRAILYFGVVLCELSVIGFGISGIGYLIYKIYKTYIYLHIDKSYQMASTVILLLIVLIPVIIIAAIICYITRIAYYLVKYLEYPFSYDNNLLVDIQDFFEELLCSFTPSRKNRSVQGLGFNSMEEFEQFNKEHPDLIMYTQDDVLGNSPNEKGANNYCFMP